MPVTFYLFTRPDEKEKYLCYGNLITPVADIIDHRYIRRKKTSLYLPADLMKRLKIYCIQEEKTMTAVLQEAIEAFVCRITSYYFSMI